MQKKKVWLTPEVFIEAASYPLTTGGWAAEARVGRVAGTAVREQKLFGPRERVFLTRDEADRYAIGLGMRWLSSRNLKNLDLPRAS
ncbi:MAG: hypothetical protein HYZ11_08090 [Candidatus Tectomicrobia bacterium]|uniref:Uncharacterized protein n=1 Tax=Tectimicrobiota bacterium TaxID=2528274 RepID=A0A932HXS3_UNCTE|nr:hypothetical protein [Candidatus Tectomicrobia bacterium]